MARGGHPSWLEEDIRQSQEEEDIHHSKEEDICVELQIVVGTNVPTSKYVADNLGMLIILILDVLQTAVEGLLECWHLLATATSYPCTRSGPHGL